MQKFEKGFFIGAATAAHQVEGNNTNSDYWAQEQLPHSSFTEPSGIACDHYHRYEEDIKLLADAGLNAYRFSIEWARVEPEEGKFDPEAVEHYRKVIACCKAHGVEPIVTLLHFTSPKWLICKGGWEAESTVEDFKKYVTYVMEQLGSELRYVCTINEANMGLQLAAISKRFRLMGLKSQAGLHAKSCQSAKKMADQGFANAARKPFISAPFLGSKVFSSISHSPIRSERNARKFCLSSHQVHTRVTWLYR